jgi:phosphodiesterase/alkaline phosphatase D-like protein
MQDNRMGDSDLNPGELNALAQVTTRLNRIEMEMDGLVSVKKWVMSLVAIFIVQMGGFIYGYGGMSERLENTVEIVRANTADRFYRTEAITLESSLRREIEFQQKITDQKLNVVHEKLGVITARVDHHNNLLMKLTGSK